MWPCAPTAHPARPAKLIALQDDWSTFFGRALPDYSAGLNAAMWPCAPTAHPANLIALLDDWSTFFGRALPD
jgi:hypothetical protein